MLVSFKSKMNQSLLVIWERAGDLQCCKGCGKARITLHGQDFTHNMEANAGGFIEKALRKQFGPRGTPTPIQVYKMIAIEFRIRVVCAVSALLISRLKASSHATQRQDTAALC